MIDIDQRVKDGIFTVFYHETLRAKACSVELWVKWHDSLVDWGSYTCQVTSDHKAWGSNTCQAPGGHRTVNRTIQAELDHPLQIEISPSVTRIEKNSNASLRCISKSDSDGGKYYSFTWKINPEDAWKEVTVRCLCAAWRPLWPECVLQRDFEGFEELEEEAVVHEIVCLGNSMGLEVDDDDVEELVEEHSKELSTEELLELHKEQNETLKRSLTSEESGEDEDKEESRIIPAKDLKDAFFCWSKLSKLAEDYHPDVGSVQKAISVFNDNVMNYFWKVQKSRRTWLLLGV
ncbi:Tigger transposable element-derived protein 1-like 156 [Homarus americanus]|uniref:Tigger transposable element-derived protein 1-like 156 n=1 Tax=Homarus americanus TaxID=6706 RepID=A0A8J5NBM0_HOMAM|nr:Tigger transposable element-derived protein 1-like 156 [Homarus americanus]